MQHLFIEYLFAGVRFFGSFFKMTRMKPPPHTHACTRTYPHTRMHTYKHTNTHTRIHTHTLPHAHTRTRVHARMHAHKHAHTHTRTRACTHTRTLVIYYARMNSCTRVHVFRTCSAHMFCITYMPTNTQITTHIHTQTRKFKKNLNSMFF